MNKKAWSVCALLLLSVFIDVSSSFASDDNDYNFSWLDPDKKIYVLQNRRYRKQGLEVFAMGGRSLGDIYRTVYQVQPRVAYWFNEDFGIEGFYSDRFNSTNNNYANLAQAINANAVTQSPYIREVTSQLGLLFNWAPWYAKINVFNSVVYFDWYFSLGAGMLNTQVGPKTIDDPVVGSQWKTDNLFAVFLGTGQMFHLNEHWKLRLDLLGHFYSAPTSGGAPNGVSGSSIFSNFAINLGVGYQL